MIRLRLITISFLYGACVLATISADPRQAYADDAGPTAPPGVSNNHAIQQFLDNIAFWEKQGQQAVALEEADRALKLSPRNADILATAARIAFETGDNKAGDSYRNKLKLVAPDDPRLETLSADLRRTVSEQHLLEEARKLSADGHRPQAIKLYREFFHGKVPNSLAAEFYLTLGSSSAEGFEEATTELGRAVEHAPSDMNLKLAYAQLQTLHEETRAQGIEQLQGLTQQPTVAEAAHKSWRQALLWQGPDAQVRAQIETYLRQYPGDNEITAKLDDVRASLPDEGVMARMRGYEADAAGRQADAEREFSAALTIHPDDAEAMVRLALIRRQQKRFAEANKLIDQALKAEPDRRDEFLTTLGQISQNDPIAEKVVRDQYAAVTRLTNQGNYRDAEKLLRHLMQSGRNAGNFLALANIQVRAGRLADAEASFRDALHLSVNNADATIGLADVLNRQGHSQEAEAMYAHAQDLYTKAGNVSGLQTLNRSRAEQLRSRAATVNDLDARVSIYRSALVLDPSYGWLRLDLASVLRKQGKLKEARQIMVDAVDVSHPSSESLQAAIVFAQQTDDLALASRLIDRLPAGEQTPQMSEIKERANVREETQQAMRNGSPATLRFRLMALAARPDATGIRGSEVGHALVRTADGPAIRSAVSAALAATPVPTARQRLAYSEVLLAAGLTEDAQDMVKGLDRHNLSDPMRKELNQVLDGAAVQRSDKLNQENHAADAFDILMPRLATDPDSPSLNLALSRLYQVNGKRNEAKTIIQTLLLRNPSNLDVRLAAVDSAISQGDLGDADRMLAEGVELFPNEPLVYVMSAHLAKARGRNGSAISDLQKARELREQQLVAR